MYNYGLPSKAARSAMAIVLYMYSGRQWCGSMTFWCGSGSADPCLELMDPDPDADPEPSIFITERRDENIKTYLKKKVFLHVTFRRYRTFTSFFKDRKPKKVTKQ